MRGRPTKNKPEDILWSDTRLKEDTARTPEVSELLKSKYAFGAVWFPPFVFEDETISLTPRFVINTTYKGYQILFNNHSFIFVITPIEPPLAPFREKAIKCFNEIIGVAQLLGIEGCAVTPDDALIFEFTGKLDKQIGQSRGLHPTVRSFLSENFLRDPTQIYEFESFCPFRQYKKSAIIEVVRKAEKIAQNREISSYILSYLDAKTHFLIEQFKTSFLLTWIVLEKYIDDTWSKTLISRNVSNKRFGKLANSMLWTVDDKLETLNLLGQISNERYFEILRLKGIRNAIVHRERNVTQEETEECLGFSLDILKEIVRNRCFVEL